MPSLFFDSFLLNQKKRRWLVVGCAVASLCAMPLCRGQETQPEENLGDFSLEQLMNVRVEKVYGASKYDQKVTEAPASVSIIDSSEIAGFGDRTMADLLRGVRGLYVTYDRNYSYLGVRGFLRPGDYNTRTLFLIDGHRMNENVYDGVILDEASMIDLDLIDRVEFIRGPSSSIYGSSAFFGVANIVTKTGKSLNGSEASAEIGTNDSYRARYTFGKVFDKDWDVLVSGSYYTTGGNRSLYYPEFDQRVSSDPRATNNGYTLDSDSQHVYQFFTDIRYHELTFTAFASSGKKMIPTASFGAVFNSRGEYTEDDRMYADLAYKHAISDAAELIVRGFWDDAHYLGYYPTSYDPADESAQVVLNRDMADGRWAGTEIQFTERVSQRLRLVSGGEYRYNIRQKQINYDDVEPRIYYVDDARQGHVLGLYAQGEYTLLPNLTIDAGLRFDDYFTEKVQSTNPRVGLIYNPNRGGSLKVLYGEAFRAPNAYEQAYLFNGASLRPEKIKTYEVAFEQYFKTHYKAVVSTYFYQVHDLINIGGSDSAFQTAVNLGRTETAGAEFELQAKYDSGLLLRGSYSLQRARDTSASNRVELTDSPRELAKLSLLAPLGGKASAGFELQYYSSMLTISGARNRAFWLANLTLYQKQIGEHTTLSATAYNLFNSNYSYPGSSDHLQTVIPQDGRELRLKVDHRF